MVDLSLVLLIAKDQQPNAAPPRIGVRALCTRLNARVHPAQRGVVQRH